LLRIRKESVSAAVTANWERGLQAVLARPEQQAQALLIRPVPEPLVPKRQMPAALWSQHPEAD
jgi:hypothetical protein